MLTINNVKNILNVIAIKNRCVLLLSIRNWQFAESILF